MNITQLVTILRSADTRFKNRIGGALDVDTALEQTVKIDTAFIIPRTESATENNSDAGIDQMITERFGVVTVLAADTSDADKTAFAAVSEIEDVRAELWRVFLNLNLKNSAGKICMESPIFYEGAEFLGFNKANLWIMFKFAYKTRIDSGDGVPDEAADLFNSVWAQYQLTGGNE